MKHVKLMIGAVSLLAFSQAAMADVGKMSKDDVNPGALACSSKETKGDRVELARLTKPGYTQDQGDTGNVSAN